ncbi:MAG: proliferating cell nuclear antigen (pcna) [archaeon]|nr:proliferating cell nuclear antigen (pcna) [archaeon]
MDSAHVSLVSLKLNDSGFEEYRCDKNITLGLNLVDFSKILKMAKTDDLLILKAEEESSYLTIIFENKNTQKTAEFQLNLLNLDAQALGIPDQQYPTYIKMSSVDFVSLCKDFTSMSDIVKISVEGNEAVFSINGKSGPGKITMHGNNAEKPEDQVEIQCAEQVACSYGLQYLNSFAKASSLSTVVTLNISKDFPLMIEYDIADCGFVKFYLAPKMDNEESGD